MLDEHLPSTILKNMNKQKIFDDLLINMKRSAKKRRIPIQTESNFMQILENKVDFVDKLNNELNGINTKKDKKLKEEKSKKNRAKLSMYKLV
jgi:hypothetical protein